MTEFAGHSLLCRLALTSTAIDAGRFTAIRLASGALALWPAPSAILGRIARVALQKLATN